MFLIFYFSQPTLIFDRKERVITAKAREQQLFMAMIIAGFSKIVSLLLSQNPKMTSCFPCSLKFISLSHQQYFEVYKNVSPCQSQWLSFRKLVGLAFSFQFVRPRKKTWTWGEDLPSTSKFVTMNHFPRKIPLMLIQTCIRPQSFEL